METTTTSEQIRDVLGRAVNPIVARGVLRFALQQCDLTEDSLDRQNLTLKLVEELEHGLRLMSRDESAVHLCRRGLHALLDRRTAAVGGPNGGTTRHRAAEKKPTSQRQFQGETIEIQEEVDIVRARGRARGLAQRVGFGATDQTKIATAVSEVSRNIFAYAREGTVSLMPLVGNRGLRIEARDNGPGIVGLDGILSGDYSSKTGMGLGLRGCKRLMDRFRVETSQGKGTLVIMEKEIA
jgi:serine/threonine-protein kinase RsbT